MQEVFKEYIFDGMKYQIGCFGTIIGQRGVLKQRVNYDGYLEVTMGKEKGKRTSVRVHRVVAKCFLPNPNNLPEVNHKDFNRQNARYDNLEWISHQDNVKYSYSEGHYNTIKKVGSNNGRAILNEDNVKQIKILYKNGTTIKALSDMYNVSWSTISCVVKGKTWTHLK